MTTQVSWHDGYITRFKSQDEIGTLLGGQLLMSGETTYCNKDVKSKI